MIDSVAKETKSRKMRKETKEKGEEGAKRAVCAAPDGTMKSSPLIC